jgi:hypothetical protein
LTAPSISDFVAHILLKTTRAKTTASSYFPHESVVYFVLSFFIVSYSSDNFFNNSFELLNSETELFNCFISSVQFKKSVAKSLGTSPTNSTGDEFLIITDQCSVLRFIATKFQFVCHAKILYG